MLDKPQHKSQNHVTEMKDDNDDEDEEDKMKKDRRTFLTLDDYDSIGFDLDHTLCRYNLGPMIRLEYNLLANFLVDKRGYDPAIRHQPFDVDVDFVCKGLTLDIEKGNLLRLGKDGAVLAASHGTRKINDIEIERVYGRNRKNHVASEYATHLHNHGPLGMGNFGLVIHSFMDYFDYPTILLCGRIVDVLDQINNHGRPMEEYYFWPDVLDGLKEMFTRTQFSQDLGGYFPEIKSHPEKFILKRSLEFRNWLKMLRQNGKFLYVITGSHVDFASHVASHALGDDWMDLFDIVIFFARKPSFFVDRRPFFKLDGDKETDPISGWNELNKNQFYSQGNWHDLNEFFEYATEWEPSASLYFGDNILQDILAPHKFTKSCDTVAVSEEMIAEGMVGHPSSHPAGDDLISSIWGSYFHHPEPVKRKGIKVLSRASSLAKRRQSVSDNVENGGRNSTTNTSTFHEMKKTLNLRRVSSFRTELEDQTNVKLTNGGGGHMHGKTPVSNGKSRTPTPRTGPWGPLGKPPLPNPTSPNSVHGVESHCSSPDISNSPVDSLMLTPLDGNSEQVTPMTPLDGNSGQVTPMTPLEGNSGQITPMTPQDGNSGQITPCDRCTPNREIVTPSDLSNELTDSPLPPKGHSRVNTLWGTCIKEYAKMCIPDLEVLADYPIDYKFPVFSKNKDGETVGSGFFPADPISLHINPPSSPR